MAGERDPYDKFSSVVAAPKAPPRAAPRSNPLMEKITAGVVASRANAAQSGASANKTNIEASFVPADKQSQIAVRNTVADRNTTLTPAELRVLEGRAALQQAELEKRNWMNAHGNLTGLQYKAVKDQRSSLLSLEKLAARHLADYNENFNNQGLATPREYLPNFVSPTNSRYDNRAKMMFPMITQALGLATRSIDTAKEQELYSKYLSQSGTQDKDADERFANLMTFIADKKGAVNQTLGVPQAGGRPPLASFFKPKGK